MKSYQVASFAFVSVLLASRVALAQEPPAPPAEAPSSEPSLEPLPEAPLPPRSIGVPPLQLRSTTSVYAAPNAGAESEDAPAYTPSKPNSYLRFGLGARVTYAPNAGLDPFTESDSIGQVSLEVSRTLLARGKTSLAIGVGWDVGAKKTTARGVDSDLTHHRILVPIEGRYHFASWLYGFGKVAPGASLLALAVKDASAPTELSDLRPGFALDASVGASFLIIGHGPADQKKARLWATPEFGYGWTTSSRPTLGTDTREDVLGVEEGASMNLVAVRGGFFRLGIGVTY